jgi:ribosomal-protein-alanine N-acetyltransferase
MLYFNFTPFTEITTSRLLLRHISLNDAAAFFLLRSDEKVMMYIDKEPLKNITEAEILIQRIEDDLQKNDAITWGICLPNNPGQLLGTIGFWRILKDHYRAEVGYMLHPDLWNKGFMHEALKQVINFGFETIKLHSIEAHINPGNAASAALLLKSGFTQDAYFKEDYFFRGKFLDSAIFSLINK